MSTSFQGALASGGHTGLLSGLRRPVSGIPTVPEPALTQLEQVSQEQSLSNQIRKLTVSLFVIFLDPAVDNAPGDPSLPLTRS